MAAPDNLKYKHPDEVLDFVMDWADWLDEVGDTISSSSWSAPPGLTLDSYSHTDTTATAWLSGGTDGNSYSVRNTIETAGGRTAARSLLLGVTAVK
jgi:hypothetical protein